MPRWLSLVAVLVALVTVIACGGGGGGTGPEGTYDGYQVMISITGLQGSGLVVQNNGSGDFPVPPNGDRAFFNNVKKGATYNITVSSQPQSPWQTCAVARGSGTVGNGDVTNVVITCVTNTYAVKGTISGLTGSGLTLRMNGGSDLAVTAGTSTFAFSAIPSMAAFAVTVATQPTGQTCTVGNGSGAITDADFTGVNVTCGAPGFTVGGDAIVGSSGLTLRLNGGAPMSVAAGASTFMFPNTLPNGATWNILVVDQPRQPIQTCTLIRAKGKISGANAAGLQVHCFGNSNLAGTEGSYAIVMNGRKQYLTFWLDGTYALATRLESPTCTNAGNGIEYGVYRRLADGSFFIRMANQDTNGECGLYNPANRPNPGPTGSLQRNGTTLTLSMPGDPPFTFTSVGSDPGTLVGAFVRADGNDGTVIVFEADGTYLYLESQEGPGLNLVPGYERGCYVASGSSFTSSLGSACRPDGAAALDLNGPGGGFSGKNGAAIPFQIVGPSAAMIDGVAYRRLLPTG